MVYDHLGDRMLKDLDSTGFKTFIHAKPTRKQCTERGIKEAVMPLSESRSRFTLIFESKSIRVLQNMDLYNFTQIMLIWMRFLPTLDPERRIFAVTLLVPYDGLSSTT